MDLRDASASKNRKKLNSEESLLNSKWKGEDCSDIEDPIKRDEAAPGNVDSEKWLLPSYKNWFDNSIQALGMSQGWSGNPRVSRWETQIIAKHSAEMFPFKGALVPVTLGGSHPLGKTALYEGDAYVIQYAVRCQHLVYIQFYHVNFLWPSSIKLTECHHSGREGVLMLFISGRWLNNNKLAECQICLIWSKSYWANLEFNFEGQEEQHVWEGSKRNPCCSGRSPIKKR